MSWDTILHSANQVRLTFCTQKNGDISAKVLFVKIVSFRSVCAVQAVIHTRRRAQLLGVSSSLPLAIFGLTTRIPRYIGRAMVVTFLHRLAAAEFGFTA